MLRSYESLCAGPIYGATPESESDGKSSRSRSQQEQSKAERIKAQQEKERSYIWKDIGNGFEQNQHGHRRTKDHPAPLF